MSLKIFSYRSQFFLITIIMSLISMQIEPIMSERGVATSTTLDLISIVQIIVMATTFLWGKVIHQSKKAYLWIRYAFIVRIIIMTLMCFHVDNTVFIALFLLFHTVSSAFDVAYEAQLLRWSNVSNVNFGRIRLFGSIGFSISGVFASGLLYITNNLNSILITILIAHTFFLILAFLHPIRVETTPKEKKKVKIDRYTLLLIVLVGLLVAVPTSFGYILNNHYRVELGATLKQATFYAGLAILFGSGISEVICFFYVKKLIKKFGPEKIIFIGILASLARWLMASFVQVPLLFTTTFLFHGITFAFTFMGLMRIIEQRNGNEAIGKALTYYFISVSLLNFLFTQLFGYMVDLTSTNTFLYLFTGISLLVCLVYWQKYIKKKE